MQCQFGDDENPAVATQTAGHIPDPTYVDEWCQTIDTDDPENLIELWENKNVSAVMDSYTHGQGDDWLQNLVEHALPNKGDVGNGGCGVIGGSCSLGLDCASMVEDNLAAEYWILKAVEGMCGRGVYHETCADNTFIGFHDKLQVAHEFLQDTTIENILSLVGPWRRASLGRQSLPMIRAVR